MQKENEKAAALYESWENDVQAEEYGLEDAEVVFTAYGASARVAKAAVDVLRGRGKRAGLIRPQTVHPFPFSSFEKLDYARVKAVVDVEMSVPALMVQDVDRAVRRRCPIRTCLCSGGNIMKKGQVLETAEKLFELFV
jgi:2-oxoglutarate ferredoxin oxidoreductase subunit alpha